MTDSCTASWAST